MINIQSHLDKLEVLKEYMNAWIEIRADRILKIREIELLPEIRKKPGQS